MNEKKTNKVKGPTIGLRDQNGKFSSNEDNNDIELFIGWTGKENEASLRLEPQIRG